MSTVVWQPDKKAGPGHTRCKIKHADWDNDVDKKFYSVNTIIRCDECGQLWIVRHSTRNMWMDYYSLRRLRWFHFSRRKIPKQVQA